MITIEQFKKFWQVKQDGYTVALFTSESEAKLFASSCSNFAAADAHLGQEGVCKKFGTTTRKISIYP